MVVRKERMMNDRCLKMFLLTVMAVMGLALGAGAEEGATEDSAGEGHRIYVKVCSGCHKLTDQTSKGPGFQGVMSRHTEAWLDKWLQDPKAMIESGDPDAKKLKEKFRVTMPTIKAMADENARREIIKFLKDNDKNVAQ